MSLPPLIAWSIQHGFVLLQDLQAHIVSIRDNKRDKYSKQGLPAEKTPLVDFFMITYTKNPQDKKFFLVTWKCIGNLGVTDARGTIGTDIAPKKCQACVLNFWQIKVNPNLYSGSSLVNHFTFLSKNLNK